MAGDGRAVLTQELASPEYGEQLRVACRCFDVERDAFPYPDASFALVLFCEVLEHLVANPVHAPAEIHRVLAPGGVLVVSTPNVARADNLAALLRGDNVYDPYHLGAPLAGSRHVTSTPPASSARCSPAAASRSNAWRITTSARIACAPRASSPRSRGSRRASPAPGTASIFFARARKTAAPFRWHFSPRLFDPAHLTFHRAPRDACVVVGENDVPHLGWGWEAAAPGPDGAPCRRCVAGEVRAAPVQVRVVAADGVLVRRVAVGD